LYYAVNVEVMVDAIILREQYQQEESLLKLMEGLKSALNFLPEGKESGRRYGYILLINGRRK